MQFTQPSPIFEWYENRAQRDLQLLYREDQTQRQKIHEVIAELNDSNMFARLMCRFTDAFEAAQKADDPQAENAAVMGLVARMYIAGTHRGEQVLDA